MKNELNVIQLNLNISEYGLLFILSKTIDRNFRRKPVTIRRFV